MKIYRYAANYRANIYGCPADYWAKIVADLDIRKINLVCRRLRVILYKVSSTINAQLGGYEASQK